jgi:hypothetical protein
VQEFPAQTDTQKLKEGTRSPEIGKVEHADPALDMLTPRLAGLWFLLSTFRLPLSLFHFASRAIQTAAQAGHCAKANTQ